MPSRGLYLPISPSNPHPDNSILLYLHSTSASLKKNSYINMESDYEVPFQYLATYRSTPSSCDPFLSDESFEVLIQYLDQVIYESNVNSQVLPDEEGWKKVEHKRQGGSCSSRENSPADASSGRGRSCSSIYTRSSESIRASAAQQGHGSSGSIPTTPVRTSYDSGSRFLPLMDADEEDEDEEEEEDEEDEQSP